MNGQEAQCFAFNIATLYSELNVLASLRLIKTHLVLTLWPINTPITTNRYNLMLQSATEFNITTYHPVISLWLFRYDPTGGADRIAPCRIITLPLAKRPALMPCFTLHLFCLEHREKDSCAFLNVKAK